MPELTPEEELLFSYIGPKGIEDSNDGSLEPTTEHNFRELRLTGWNERDEKNVSGQISFYWQWHMGWVTGHGDVLPRTYDKIEDYWKIFAIFTFSLRRPLYDWEVSFILLWYRQYTTTVSGEKINKNYTYYDGDKVYRDHAIFLDPTKAFFDNPTLVEVSGKLNSQRQLQLPTVELEITKPREIPQFPQWDDKIINRFHRSADPEMQEYTKAIGDWSALMHNAISQLA